MSEFWQDDSGAGMGGYALIAALVSVGLMTVIVEIRDSTGRLAFVANPLDGSPDPQTVG